MFRIFASLTSRTLGDFATHALLVSSIRELFDEGKLYINYRDDRPYKSPILSCLPNLSGVVRITDPKVTLPVDYFDVAAGAPEAGNADFNESDMRRPHLALLEPMLHQDMLNTIPLARFRPPENKIEASDEALIALGLDPTRWVAAVYWKEKDYEHRGYSPLRTIKDPAPYVELVRHIVEDLGGQVVRLGHPTPTVLPDLPGIVDLANVKNSEWLQLYGVAISRFMIASASGPSVYGPAFAVPTAITDLIDCSGVWHEHDYMLTRAFERNGRVYRQQEAYEAGFLHYGLYENRDFVMTRNTAAELIATAGEMLASTTGCLGWRNFLEEAPPIAKPNTLSFPIARRERPDLMIPPSRRPKAKSS